MGENSAFLASLWTWVFLLLPSTLLVSKWFLGRFLPWWLLLLVCALVGWFAAHLRVHFYFESLAAEYDSYTSQGVEPPAELTEAMISDGAARVFAFYFGWLFSVIWLVPWIVIFVLIHRLVRVKKEPIHAPQPTHVSSADMRG
tara:strand:- start:16 stop:444 length:429 start_codon:yes stop_codon:yes gene_type:complete